MEKLPVFKLKINTDVEAKQQVEFVALVDNPAIEVNWQMFDKHYKFTGDVDRQIITGPFMIADQPIYRKGKVPFTNEEGEYYVVFDKETIFEVVNKFFQTGKTSNFNLMHNKNNIAKDTYLIESFIIDSSRGVVPPKGFEGLSEGSWVASVRVIDDRLWDSFIKTGELKGFSVEGLFVPEFLKVESPDILETIADIVSGS